MKEDTKQPTTSEDEKIIHVQVIDGTPEMVQRIGKDMERFSESLPYKLHAIITTDKVYLKDIDVLYEMLKKLKEEKDKTGDKDDKVSNL